MDPSVAWSLFLTIITFGGLYALIATGLNLVHGVTKILNYAYGAFFAIGAYLGWTFLKYYHLGFPAMFALAILILFFIGALVERVLLKPLIGKKAWQENTLFILLGLALFIHSLLQGIFGPDRKIIPWLLGEEQISKIVILFIVIFILISLWLFLNKTMKGKAVRAVAQDIDGAKMIGINVDAIFTYVFAFSTVLVGIAGIFLAPRTQIFPLLGWDIFVMAFIIVVLGGLGSIGGAVIAAYMISTMHVLISYFIGGEFVMPILFVILIIILIFKPKGLMGT